MLFVCVFPLFSQNREDIKRQIDSLQAILDQLDQIESLTNPESTESSSWSIEEFTDKFDRPTGEKFIYTKALGQFSNSATTNSDLLAFVGITKEEIFFQLYEYAKMLVKGEGYYVISMLSDEKEYLFFSELKQNRLFIKKYNDKKFSTKEVLLRELLKEGKKKLYIQNSRNVTYKFDIETNGLNDIYNSVFK